MSKKVLKFGGTSVGTIERIQHVASIVKKEHLAGNNVVVIVSAMAGKTNELIKLSKEISDKFKNLIISTGATYDSEIKKTFEILDKKKKNFSFLHCVPHCLSCRRLLSQGPRHSRGRQLALVLRCWNTTTGPHCNLWHLSRWCILTFGIPFD